MHQHTRRNVLTVLKIALAIAILVYLVFQARDAIATLSEKTIEWPFLAAAVVCSLVTTGLSFVRWHILIRALDMDMRLVDSLRLGALGFALNFVSPGSIGGDFFKAIFLAHGHPGKRTEAVATVVADRLVGLLTMLALACVGIWVTGMLHTGPPWLRVLCQSILVAAAISWLGFVLIIFLGGRAGTWIRNVAEKIPVAGKTIARLLGAVDVYRSRKQMLLGALGVSAGMALGFATTFYLVARGLPIHEPSWLEHLVIAPVASLVGAIPLTPSGLGTTELAIEKLYSAMPGGVPDDGTLVGLGRRATDLVVAFIGLGFYLSHRREVDEVFAEAEHEADAEE